MTQLDDTCQLLRCSVQALKYVNESILHVEVTRYLVGLCFFPQGYTPYALS